MSAAEPATSADAVLGQVAGGLVLFCRPTCWMRAARRRSSPARLGERGAVRLLRWRLIDSTSSGTHTRSHALPMA
jgi:hypothetical protein